MGATNSCSKATLELQTAFLKPVRDGTQISRGLRKAICSSHAALHVEQLLHTIARGFRKICENSKAFCKR
jgi:hypothetical protein